MISYFHFHIQRTTHAAFCFPSCGVPQNSSRLTSPSTLIESPQRRSTLSQRSSRWSGPTKRLRSYAWHKRRPKKTAFPSQVTARIKMVERCTYTHSQITWIFRNSSGPHNILAILYPKWLKFCIQASLPKILGHAKFQPSTICSFRFLLVKFSRHF